ncbi:thiol reductant ABC exporter subunit CydD [Halalkalibacterium halodurans]|nr:thiol reductant ABC exporter subunit CydD [Halalkalibacterium halodurans]MED4082597.1 thiol reductant ABC exporter subunit CydD [Halalkalibacterium halodurans]MED4086718.1 thiol reductant ABC exporter subunit CydD [Halalkalibacterium halodurans]MED4105598.1 thiol reductant ABC exporter subunit CydD [Halalkalibacterium halodurans]MED4110591.1 thiol reductant ABC exporter subunit CydD [Halalkalibacterium halodurans]MED4124860.1 thiol reductant ABC exporter subunit CydD [Halalkalibacterium hal
MAMMLLTFLTGVAIIIQAYLIVSIIDQLFLQAATFQDVVPLLIGLIAALFARTFSRLIIDRIGNRIATDAKIHMRAKLLRHFTKKSLTSSSKTRTGETTSYFLDTVDETGPYFNQYVPQMIQSLIIPILLLIVIFWEHWASGVIILVTAPFLFVYMIIIGMRTGDKSKEQMEKMADFSGIFLDTLQGLNTIKFFGQTRQQRSRIKEKSLEFREATMSVLKIAFSNSLALEFISMLSIGIIALEVAIRMIIVQDTIFASGFLMLVLAPELYTKLKELGSAFHSGKASKGALEKVNALLKEPVEDIPWGHTVLSEQEPPLLQMKNVHFQYGEGFALSSIDFLARPYEKIAIIGATGSGKSTLLHLLAGLNAADSGEYDLNGHPRATVDKTSWFKQMSLISQDGYLFAGTIGENIVLGTGKPRNEESIIQAAKEAGVYEWIEGLPEGLDTVIGEGGRGLSGGERQRVLMARAFYKKPNVVLFDEPTAGLDLETETILQTSLEKLNQQSTVIIVAHRLYTIRKADVIVLLENGRLRATGNHDTLWENDPLYRQMITTQQGGRRA